MTNRKLLMKTRQQAGIRSDGQTLADDLAQFRHVIPSGLLDMDKPGFQRHFGKLIQTNYLLACMYVDNLARKKSLSGFQIEVIQGYIPGFEDRHG